MGKPSEGEAHLGRIMSRNQCLVAGSSLPTYVGDSYIEDAMEGGVFHRREWRQREKWTVSGRV